MAEFFRRLAMGCVWFVIFWLGLSVVGGGIAGAVSSRDLVNSPGTAQEHFERGYQVGQAAGAEFHRRYGHVLTLMAVVLALGGTVTGVLPGTARRQ
jgi:hypothetical protein